MTIFSTFNYYSESNMQAIKECLQESFDTVTEDMIYNACNNQLNSDWTNVQDKLLDFFDDQVILVTATIGRWNGTFNSSKIGIFENLIIDMLNKQDDFEIESNNGEFLIKTYHHDGQNNFEIKILTFEAEDILDKFDNNELDYSENELCKIFYEDDKLTVLPNYVG